MEYNITGCKRYFNVSPVELSLKEDVGVVTEIVTEIGSN